MENRLVVLRNLFALSMFGLVLATNVLAEDIISNALRVKPNQTFVITAAQSTMVLDEVYLDDDVQIKFADDVHVWSLSAKRARIGKNVLIDGRGIDGQPGTNGEAWPGAAKQCEDGEKGRDANMGTAGTQGVSINLKLGIEDIGSLIINTAGGVGGRGGVGGNGQVGGSIHKCNGANGGMGGSGGKGGSGGDAGNVSVNFWDISGKEQGQLYSSLITVRADAGPAGMAGDGGTGGAVASGFFEDFAGGRKKWWPAGKPGEPGRFGEKGIDGKAGRVMVLETNWSGSGSNAGIAKKSSLPANLRTESAARVPEIGLIGSAKTDASAENISATLKLLGREIELIKGRLDQLEKRR